MASVSCVIPLYNEEANIPALIDAFRATIPLLCDDFELIFVDDASIDKTPFMLDALAASDEKIKVLHNKTNRTLGGSLREGFKTASRELVLYFDADLPFDLKEVKNALALMRGENADGVCAYRINRKVEGVRRCIYSFVYNRLITHLFHLDIKDVNFSFKLFKRNILNAMKLESEGSFINAEIFVKADMEGYRIVQFPVLYHPREKGRSTLSRPAVIFKMLKEVFYFYCTFYKKHLVLRKNLYQQVRSWYRGLGFRIKVYSSIRLQTCPFDKIEKYIPKAGKVLDVGCGFGLFDFWMYLRSEKREIIGVDWIKERINVARRICQAQRCKINFTLQNINEMVFDSYDAVVWIDVLYLFPHQIQEQLLRKCFIALKPGGSLFIKEINTAPFLKYIWCFIQEFIVTTIGKNNQSRGVYMRNSADLISMLTDIGFTVQAVRMDRGYFYPHVLYVCQKQNAAGSFN